MSTPSGTVRGLPPDTPRWREYPLSPAGWLATSAARTLPWGLGGIGVASAAIGAFALVNEQGLLGSGRASVLVDQFARNGLITGILWGAVLLLLLMLAEGLTARSTSRALVRAARAGADPQVVPVPHQVRTITGPPFLRFVTVAVVLALLAGLITGVGWFVILGDGIADHADEWPLLLVLTVLEILPVLVGVVLHRAGSAAEQTERPMTAAHWPRRREAAAWARAERRARGVVGGEAPPTSGRRPGILAQAFAPTAMTIPGSGRLRLGNAGVFLGAAAGGIAALFFNLIVAILYPDADPITRELGEPEEFGTRMDAMVDVAYWVLTLTILISVVLLAAGTVLIVQGHRRAMGALVELAESGRAGQAPAIPLDAADGAMSPSPGLGSRLMVALGAMAVQLGGTYAMINSPWLHRHLDEDLVITLNVPVLGMPMLVVGVLLVFLGIGGGARVLARTNEERNIVLAHWPVRPEATKESDPALRGPALGVGLGGRRTDPSAPQAD